MRRKVISIVLILAMVLALALFVACDKNVGGVRTPTKTIVYLGDSIAEALIGPSPLSERDNYGYYALVARSNNYKYYNHSVSGHKTSGDMMGNTEGGLLYLLQREEESATLMQTHIKQADIIHISIGGNNLLQYDLGLLMLEVADEEFENKFAAGTTLINLLHDGGSATRESLDVDEHGEHRTVNFVFPDTYQDICDIIDILREMNPTAKIFFQKVYNPVVGGSKFLYPELLAALAEITDDGRFGAEGTKITTIEQIRAIAQELLNHLNGMFDEYLEEHPNSIYILDANKTFDDYVKRDVRDGKVFYGDLEHPEVRCKGADLFFSDWTHPSNIGHAVLAATTQAKFEELGLADAGAVDAYKAIKIEQVNRMFDGVEGFNTKQAIAAINAATTFQGVTDAYFAAIQGFLPKYC